MLWKCPSWSLYCAFTLIFLFNFFSKILILAPFSHINETRNPVLGLVLQKYKFRLWFFRFQKSDPIMILFLPKALELAVVTLQTLTDPTLVLTLIQPNLGVKILQTQPLSDLQFEFQNVKKVQVRSCWFNSPSKVPRGENL